jgi:hypothetical protein
MKDICDRVMVMVVHKKNFGPNEEAIRAEVLAKCNLNYRTPGAIPKVVPSFLGSEGPEKVRSCAGLVLAAASLTSRSPVPSARCRGERSLTSQTRCVSGSPAVRARKAFMNETGALRSDKAG